MKSQRLPFAGSCAALPRRRDVRARGSQPRRRTFVLHDEEGGASASPDTRVSVYPTAERCASSLCAHVLAEAQSAIAERGVFVLAVPGGSVLKLLAGLRDNATVDWSRVVLLYANHKAVALEAENATHLKARRLFLDSLTGITVLAPSGGEDARAEAVAYCAALAAEKRIAKASDGSPQLDLCVLGVGSDGHVGSLYPGRPELELTDAPCVAVQKGSGPGSITLSLPTMSAARSVVLCMVGASKADAAVQALESQPKRGEFPAALVRCEGTLRWLLDADAASKLRATGAVGALV